MYDQIDIRNLYDRFCSFNSLNCIHINTYPDKLKIYIELEFYEPEYILEELNNPCDFDNITYNLQNCSFLSLFYTLIVKYYFINKKRIDFNHNNIHEVVFINSSPGLKYDRHKYERR